MWISLVTVCVITTAQLAKSFSARHEPEPPNSRLKLPFCALALAGCVALAVVGIEPVLFSLAAAILVVQIGFVLAGRNPWWMRAAIDKREYVRYSAPPRDLER
jgi:hypothetical protein